MHRRLTVSLHLCRPSENSRSSCWVAVGTEGFGVALLSLTFNQQGPAGISSCATQLLPHTASVLRMCVSWDHTPAVCPFPLPPPGERSDTIRPDAAAMAAAAAATGFVGMPLVAPNASIWWEEGQTADPVLQAQQQQSDASQYGDLPSTSVTEERPECLVAVNNQATAQQNREMLAAACDRTHLFVIWGPSSLESPQQSAEHDDSPSFDLADTSPSLSTVEARERSQLEHSTARQPVPDVATSRQVASLQQTQLAVDRRSGLHDSSSRHPVCQSSSSKTQGSNKAAAGVDADDLVAHLRRLRPHLHASGPFSPTTTAAAAAVRGRSPAPDRSLHKEHAQSEGQSDIQLASTTSDANVSTEQPAKVAETSVAQCLPGTGIEASGEPALPPDADHMVQHGESCLGTPCEQLAQQQTRHAAAAREGDKAASYPSWPSSPWTPHQLRALQSCCSTVACFDVPHRLAHVHPHGQTAPHGSAQGQPTQQDPGEGCGVQPRWSYPIVAASHLSAGHGALAVACSDGMLLLLDQATGDLIR